MIEKKVKMNVLICEILCLSHVYDSVVLYIYAQVLNANVYLWLLARVHFHFIIFQKGLSDSIHLRGVQQSLLFLSHHPPCFE